MRRSITKLQIEAPELVELRRVVRCVSNRQLRTRLVRVVDDLVRDAGWDPVEEIVAGRRIVELEAQLAVARAERATLLAAAELARDDAGRARHERDVARQRLAELRELARPALAADLTELRVRLEAERPTSPPPMVLRQATRLAEAVRVTG